MQLDINALIQHGALFGIDSDPIRAAHAYRNQLGNYFAEGRAASSCHTSGLSQPLNTFSHLQAKEVIMLIPASATGKFSGSCFSLHQSAKVSSSREPASDAPCEGNSTDASSVCVKISSSSTRLEPCALPPNASTHSVVLTRVATQPLRVQFTFEGIDPNGPDADVGSPVKQQRLH